MKVYRVQDSAGRGPWRPGFSSTWVQERPDHDNLIPWNIEFPKLHNAIQRYHKLGWHLGCGCRAATNLRRWFTHREYATLLEYGYQAVILEAEGLIAESETQLIFKRRLPLNTEATPFDLYTFKHPPKSHLTKPSP